MKFLRMGLLFCRFFVFVMGCSKTEPDRISAIVNQTDPWSGNFEMKWDLTGISLKGKLSKTRHLSNR